MRRYALIVRRLALRFGLVPLLLVPAAGAGDPPAFSKAFGPSTIGPGSVSTLAFTISNPAPFGVTDLAFSDSLPAGVTIADPANAASTCGGTLSAPDGGGAITFSAGSVAANASCLIRVDVTSATPDTHMNVSGDLTSSAGNSGSASADLTVATDRPGFLMSFAPNPVQLGGRSTLTFTIDNTANPAGAVNLTFSDNLPIGMEVSSPANASTTCSGGLITANPGSGSIAYGPAFLGDAAVAAMSSCTVSVDVTATAAFLGPATVIDLHNISGELTSVSPMFVTRSSGKASATLTVTVDPLALIKDFTDDPVPPGGTVTLQFTIVNFNRFESATAISFTDDLDATLSGLMATGLPLMNPCNGTGMLAGSAGDTFLTFSGGSLAPEAFCTFSVTLQVPAGAASGVYPNTTSAVTGDVGGAPVMGSPATEDLFVAPVPLLTKEFTDDPVGPGDMVNLEFTITNSSSTSSATDIAFMDVLTTFLPFPVTVSLPPTPDPPCGAGSMLALVSCGFECHALSLTGGSLMPAGMAGDSCTFSVGVSIPMGFPGNTYTNTTSPISATVEMTTVTGNPASDDLVVVGAPRLQKEFTDDPAQPGDTVTLEFTLTHDPNAAADATGIAFTDDLNAVITGLTATLPPAPDPPCGVGSSLTGSAGNTFLTFAGGTLMPGASCTFSVILNVPAGALPGLHTNTTSDVTATVSGVATAEHPATDELRIAGLTLTKEFTDDPVIPGGTVTLEFTIDNITTASNATDIFFTDDLANVLSGLTATGLPMMNVCNGTGTLSGSAGNTFLTFSGGSLTAGSSCTFSVTLDVPAGAASNTYPNTTSAFSATMEMTTIAFDNASDNLVVSSDRLDITKSFTDDPVSPGESVTLEFTITNLDAAQGATGITFSDDLNAALSGLAAVGLPAMDVCGAGSMISGSSLLTLTDGSLAAGASCTFSVTLQVPANAPGGTFLNTTSSVSGTIGGLGVSGDPASDNLRIINVTFAKAFNGPTTATGMPVLTFTITNLDQSAGIADLQFSDDLNATLSGLMATGLPISNVCGAGSQISGTGFLTFTGGNLGPGAMCMFNVTLQVPPGAPPGSYPNTTSDLLSAGLPVADPATATLVVEPPPLFSKSFAPDPIDFLETSTLTFVIDNSASAVPATNLDFTDNLPAGLEVANPPSAATTCVGGTLTAAAGSGVISYTGGTVAAGASCTISVDLTATAAGMLVNTTGDLTSSSGNSGTATDTLTVNAIPILTIGKDVDDPGPVLSGDVLTYTLMGQNVGVAPATNVVVLDPVPAMTTYVAGSCTTTHGTCSLNGANVEFLIGTLNDGDTATLTFMVEVDPAPLPQGTIVNQNYTIDSDQTDPVAGPAVSIGLVPVELLEFESIAGGD